MRYDCGATMSHQADAIGNVETVLRIEENYDYDGRLSEVFPSVSSRCRSDEHQVAQAHHSQTPEVM